MPITIEQFTNQLTDRLVQTGDKQYDAFYKRFTIVPTKEIIEIRRYHKSYEKKGLGYYLYRITRKEITVNRDGDYVNIIKEYSDCILRNVRDLDVGTWILHRVAPSLYPETYENELETSLERSKTS